MTTESPGPLEKNPAAARLVTLALFMLLSASVSLGITYSAIHGHACRTTVVSGVVQCAEGTTVTFEGGVQAEIPIWTEVPKKGDRITICAERKIHFHEPKAASQAGVK